MATNSYAWFLNKVDWATFTFWQPHSAYTIFNNLPMWAALIVDNRTLFLNVKIYFINISNSSTYMRLRKMFSTTLGQYHILQWAYKSDNVLKVEVVVRHQCLGILVCETTCRLVTDKVQENCS